MSKSIRAFFNSYAAPEKLMPKIIDRTPSAGSRIVPTNRKDDKAAQLRIDAGEKIGDKQNFYLQVNSQATSGALKDFVTKNGRGTHANLAIGTFDAKAADKDAETRRMIQDMEAQARSKVG